MQAVALSVALRYDNFLKNMETLYEDAKLKHLAGLQLLVRVNIHMYGLVAVGPQHPWAVPERPQGHICHIDHIGCRGQKATAAIEATEAI